MAAELAETDEVNLFSTEDLLALANDLRRLYTTHPSEELKTRILWLQRCRDMVLKREWLQTRGSYAMDSLISALVVAGFMRSLSQTSEVIRHAAAVAITDPALRKHILGHLALPRGVPAASTGGAASSRITSPTSSRATSRDMRPWTAPRC